jgi:tetratricopeptide (TPR) repeat protein
MAWYNLGLLQTEMMQMDSAMYALRKAIAIKPNYSEAYYNLASVYAALGFSEDAIQTYRRCATTSATFAGDSYHALALLYRKLGNFSEALRAHAQAIQITDTSQVYRSERLRTCFDADRCADAAGFIDRDVEQFPKSATVLYHAARCYLRSNRRERAEQLLAALEQINPSLADDLKTLMRM